MMTNATALYGPMANHINKIKNASSDSERLALIDEMILLDSQLQKQFKEFDSEFDKICRKNIELEERIVLLDELLDKRMAETPKEDLDSSLISCQEIYKDSWNKLDSFSQKYLVMANYLYNILNDDCPDFSPSILEYGRALENEFTKKIFDDFFDIIYLNCKDIEFGKDYQELKGAIKKYEEKGTYFIAERAQIRYLTYLSDINNQKKPTEKLRDCLNNKNIDISIISEESFTQAADTIFEQYRNKAAHPGITFNKDEASSCREKTKKVIKKFMKAVP